MPDPDDLAVLTLHRNRHKAKCIACGGSGHVFKYIRPNVVGMVQCLSCKGTGRGGPSAPKPVAVLTPSTWLSRFSK